MGIAARTALACLLLAHCAHSQLLYGCTYDASLCGQQELCDDDGLFGQCRSRWAPPSADALEPLSAREAATLAAVTRRLLDLGLEWRDARTQCAVAYFIFSVRNDLPYDAQFCNVRRPENLSVLLQRVQSDLSSEPEEPSLAYYDDAEAFEAPMPDSRLVSVDEAPPDVYYVEDMPLDDRDLLDGFAEQLPDAGEVAAKRGEPSSMNDEYRLTADEERVLNEMLLDVMRGDDPDLRSLSDSQLDKFIAYVELMRRMIRSDGETAGQVEAEEDMRPDDGGQQLLFKKDSETIGNVNLGLANTRHNIVKGRQSEQGEQAVYNVDGDRVYIRLNKDFSHDIDKLAELATYLKEEIARPKNLTFTDFRYGGKEISFSVRGGDAAEALSGLRGVDDSRRLLLHSGSVVDAVNKRTRQIQRVTGARVTGSGIDGEAPLQGGAGDSLALPTLVVCGLVVGVLLSVLAVYVAHNRSLAKHTLRRVGLDVEGRPDRAYEELCRQRMATKSDGAEPLSGVVSAVAQRLGSQGDSPSAAAAAASLHSSTSSWSEEPVLCSNMDISTGHLILAYLEDHLDKGDRLTEEWTALCAYQPDRNETQVALLDENRAKNRFAHVLPYDHNLVTIGDGEYVNASPLCDSDPRAPLYVAAAAPLVSTAAEFWQMIWEQGSVVVVNLTRLAENGDAKCHRYWPESGSEVHGAFEVHVVSEHIWCEDYLVRSFYLKNLRTNETRTVTQFHYLTWADGGVAPSTKSLLEFRRKVNKSYRGRSCPIVVHCSDGAGRAGTYCLLDMMLNRINKGAKELDMAATLEHLRDQRMGLVATRAQYAFVLNCIADEVNAILKALPQQ